MTTRLLAAAALAGGVLVAGSGSALHPPGALLPAAADLFRTSDRCIGCHVGVTTPSGEDVSIGFDWRASIMANSARDPYWQAAVRREVMDHPEQAEAIQDECAKCHMPMARAAARADGALGRVFDHLAPGAGAEGEGALALDGVSCALCHQIRADGLGTEESFTGNFRLDTETPTGGREVFGPFEPDAGRVRVMHSATGFRQARSDHLATSEVCATCHTLVTHALGTGAGASLPEQMPYQEWQASAYAGTRTCQSCHMPEVAEEVRVSGVLGEPRAGVSRHTFVGGNFFMLRMFARYRNELGVPALPQELEAAAQRTIAQLQDSTAAVSVAGARVEDGRLLVDVDVRNRTGHKLPTGYPSRRAWLHVTVRDADGRVLFESGALQPDGSVRGNDNDADPLRFEPHHELIDAPDQVQVYESVMADPQSRATTGLLTAVRFAKDNRLLPEGFDVARAGPEAGVVGGADLDDDFLGGGDRVRYAVRLGDAPGPYDVSVALYYQPISFRWAQNLVRYSAPETTRFVRWYDEMAGSSAVVLARTSARVGGEP